MKDILIAIFSIEENIYLAYWLNVDDARFETVNFPELINQEEAEIPFLSDVDKLHNIFPDLEGEFYVGLARDNNYSVIVFTKEENYLSINQNIFNIIRTGLLRDKKPEIESFIEDLFSDTVDPDIQSLLTEMNQELSNYSSFISIYYFETDKLVASTIHKKKDENMLAREVFKELKRLDIIKKIDLEVELKKIGSNVQVFYFYLKGLVFVIYCINIQVNTGIIRLKLKTFLKNKPKFTHYLSYSESKSNILRLATPNFESDNKVKSLKFTIKFNNYQ